MPGNTVSWLEVCEHLEGNTHVATATPDGRPHVAVVMAGVEEHVIWFLIRSASRTAANLRGNPKIALMWQPAAEVYVDGLAEVIDDVHDKRRVWVDGILPYDPTGFFGEPENPDVVLVRVEPTAATLLAEQDGAIARRTWRA